MEGAGTRQRMWKGEVLRRAGTGKGRVALQGAVVILGIKVLL